MRKLLLISLLLFSAMAYTQQTILWKVTKPGNDHVSYLLGTYHFLGNTFVDSYPVIKKHFASSSVLITETLLDKEQVQAYFNSRPSSDTLASILSENDIAYIKNYLKSQDLSKLTPGEIFVTLNANYPKFKCLPNNANDSLFMDVYFQKMAKEKNMQIVALDEKQLDLFRQLTAQYDWKFFKKNIDNLLRQYRSDKVDQSRCAAVQKYLDLDIEYNFSGPCPTMAANNTRNEKWMQSIPGMINNSNCFIAVGVFHLTAECGLIVQLKKLGWTVEPVPMK